MKFTKIKLLTIIFSVFFSMCLLLLNPSVAKADDINVESGDRYTIQAKWIDRANIEITAFEFTSDDLLSDAAKSNGGKDYVNSQIRARVLGRYTAENISPDVGDNTSFFKDTGCGTGGGRTKIEIIRSDVTEYGVVTNNKVRLNNNNLHIVGQTSGCFDPIAKAEALADRWLVFSPGDDQNNNLWFRQKTASGGVLFRVDNQDGDFARNTDAGADPKIYKGNTVRDCLKRVQLKADAVQGFQDALYESCVGIIDPVKVYIADLEELKKPPVGANNGTTEDALDCEVQLANILTWFMCPVIEAANKAVLTLDRAITSQLTVDTTSTTSIYNQNAATGAKLFNVWANFRYIALGILVIVGLVMILSQALSFGVFDAYTIKKILPKILVGVIGISVSWYLCKFAIEFTNSLGIGVRSLLYGPFGGLNNAFLDARIVSILGVGGGIAIVGLGVIGILSFMLTALMAVIIAFAILAFRQVLIMLLVITAPVAIACWILPNTQKVWKLWWDFFSRALIVFPIIMLFIAGGRVVAQLATSTAVDTAGNPVPPGFLESTIAFIAYFGPYFALPAAFRLAGGAIATIGGVANDRSRGAFDRLKKGRQERFAHRMQQARNERLYSTDMMDKFRASKAGQTRVGRQLGRVNTNKIATWVASPHKNAAYKARGKNIPFLSRYGEGLEEGIHHAALEESVKGFQEVNDLAGNDKYYRVAGGMHDSLSSQVQAKLKAAGLHGRAMKTRSDFLTAAGIMEQSNDHTEREAAGALRKSAVIAEKWRSDTDMNYADFGSIGMMGLAAHGFMDDPDLEKGGQLLNQKYGADYAGSVVTKSEMFGAQSNPFIKAGYGHAWVNKGGEGEEAKWELVRGSQAFRHLYNDDDWNGLESDQQNVMAGRDLDVLDTMNYQSIAGMKGSNFKKHTDLLKSVIKMGDNAEAKQAYEDTKNLTREDVEKYTAGAKNNKDDFEMMKKIRMAKAYKLAPQVKKQIAIAAMPQYGNDSDTAGQAQELMDGLKQQGIQWEPMTADEASQLHAQNTAPGAPPAGVPPSGPPTSGAPPT